MLDFSNKCDILNLSIKEADFLCQNAPLVCDKETTVSLIDRRTRGFLLEDIMPQRWTEKRICKICKKEFFARKHDIKCGRGIFCSWNCRAKSKKTRIQKNCLQCGKEFDVNQYKIKKGHGLFCSKKCFNKYRRENPFGQSKRREHQRARAVYNEHHINNICEKCNFASERIEIHHKDLNETNNNIKNLQALCVKCHKKLHIKIRKKNKI